MGPRFWELVLVLILASLYFLPTIIAHSRRTKTRGMATIIDIFLGWTFLGWVVALAMAFGPTEPEGGTREVTEVRDASGKVGLRIELGDEKNKEDKT